MPRQGRFGNKLSHFSPESSLRQRHEAAERAARRAERDFERRRDFQDNSASPEVGRRWVRRRLREKPVGNRRGLKALVVECVRHFRPLPNIYTKYQSWVYAPLAEAVYALAPRPGVRRDELWDYVRLWVEAEADAIDAEERRQADDRLEEQCAVFNALMEARHRHDEESLARIDALRNRPYPVERGGPEGEVAAPGVRPDLPWLDVEVEQCTCPPFVQLEGCHPDTEGKRAVVDPRCRGWAEPGCLTWNIDRWHRWLRTCLLASQNADWVGDPAADLGRVPTGEPTWAAYRLYAAAVPGCEWKDLRRSVARCKTYTKLDRELGHDKDRFYEYFRLKLDPRVMVDSLLPDPEACRNCLYEFSSKKTIVTAIRERFCEKTHDPPGQDDRKSLYLAIFAVWPGLEVSDPRLTPVSLSDAVALMAAGLCLIDTRQDPRRDGETPGAAPNRVSVSAGWRMPGDDPGEQRWQYAARSRLSARQAARTSAALGLADSTRVRARAIQDSAVHRERHGKLCAWFYTQLMSRMADPVAIRATYEHFLPSIRGRPADQSGKDEVCLAMCWPPIDEHRNMGRELPADSPLLNP